MFVKLFKLINHIKHIVVKLDKENEERINLILNSDAVNYLETAEKLAIKNMLEKEKISELESNNLGKIIEKYEKFIKN